MAVKDVVKLGFRAGDVGSIPRLGFTYKFVVVPGKGIRLSLPLRTLDFELNGRGGVSPTLPAAVQSATERIAYTVDVYRLLSVVHSPEVLGVTDLSTGLDVKATAMPSGIPHFAAGANGTTLMVLPLLQNLTAGRIYRVECAFSGGVSAYRVFDFYVKGLSGPVEVFYPRVQPHQGENERRSYVLDIGRWSKVVSSSTVTEIIDESDGSDVKATVMLSYSPSTIWPNITLPLIRKLTAGRSYNVVVQFTGDNDSVLETHFRIRGI